MLRKNFLFQGEIKFLQSRRICLLRNQDGKDTQLARLSPEHQNDSEVADRAGSAAVPCVALRHQEAAAAGGTGLQRPGAQDAGRERQARGGRGAPGEARRPRERNA